MSKRSGFQKVIATALSVASLTALSVVPLAKPAEASPGNFLQWVATQILLPWVGTQALDKCSTGTCQDMIRYYGRQTSLKRVLISEANYIVNKQKSPLRSKNERKTGQCLTNEAWMTYLKDNYK